MNLAEASGLAAGPHELANSTSGVLIVAHLENTGPLRAALIAEGLAVEDVRGPYTPEQLGFSAVTQALVNHANAWRIAASRALPTIVMEPDFVPVVGFGKLPVPAPPSTAGTSLSYLYSVGPEIWNIAGPNIARGHGGGAVALLIPPKVAGLLLEFFEEELKINAVGKYRPWDSGMGYWLLERGIESYIPYRHYGEHGGIGNPEHAKFGMGRNHRADVLHGKLAFTPVYASGSRLRFWSTRVWARIWGCGRLLCGRFLKWHDFRDANWRQMARFAVGRLFLRGFPKWEGPSAQ